MTGIVTLLVHHKLALVEQCLIASIEVIEGRVPSGAEIAAYGHRYCYPELNREIWTWKQSTVVVVTFWPSPEVPFEILSLVNPFNQDYEK